MSAGESKTPEPPRIVVLSPTEMTGDWAAEVQKKLVGQGFDPQAAARIAGAVEAEAPRFAARASFWRRFLRLLGLAGGAADARGSR